LSDGLESGTGGFQTGLIIGARCLLISGNDLLIRTFGTLTRGAVMYFANGRGQVIDETFGFFRLRTCAINNWLEASLQVAELLGRGVIVALFELVKLALELAEAGLFGLIDGAAALIVTSERNATRLGKAPIARIVAQAVSGVEPKWVMMAPVDAVEKLLTKTGWDRDKDVDLVELNEAFAVAAIAVTRQLRLNPEKVNVNGGAVALGHPIGASGARILVTLLYELERRNLKRGIAALCLGGGNAVALAVECY